MPSFIRQVQPPLHFIPTAYSPLVMRVVHFFLPLLLKVRVRPWLPVGISRIEVENVDRLVDLYAQFESGESRFLMAVRHVEVDDPLSGLYLCSRAVNRAAKARGIQLRQPVHTHFLYERGMTIWAGKALGWFLSRIGGTPIRRGRRPDWVGLKAARKLMVEGVMPMVVAPEGATNGHSERLGPLEPGVAQLGLWCAEDLQKAQRSERVFIVPIGIQYRYEQPEWEKLAGLLSQLERQSGLTQKLSQVSVSQISGSLNDDFVKTTSLAPTPDKDCYLRILRLGEHLITVLEAFYQQFYPKVALTKHNRDEKLSVLDGAAQTDSATDLDLDCANRLTQLLDRALQVAEQFFSLSGKGTLADRCRRIEEASWQAIYREDLSEISMLSSLEKGLADWAAQAASLRALHMRIVESFVAVDDKYLKEKPSFERCAEVTLLMSDMLARLTGGKKLPGRPRLGQRWVKMTVQAPIAITPHLNDYQKDRRSGRRVVAALTEQIRVALEGTIERN
ncbi:MAG: 1-acyl-sn-glycerol-3-phosphate acyltransferase [Cyanobacteria bacterium J06621_11]